MEFPSILKTETRKNTPFFFYLDGLWISIYHAEIPESSQRAIPAQCIVYGMVARRVALYDGHRLIKRIHHV